MEQIYKNLKNFILESVNNILPSYEDEKIKLPKVENKNIVFGVIDPVKNTANVICSIYPENQSIGEQDISGAVGVESSVTVTFLCRGANYETLMSRICRYASAFKYAITENYSVDDTCVQANISNVQFYPDCGVTEKTATAVEIEMTIYSEFNNN